MSRQALKLTIYFGERQRVEGQFLADRLLGLFANHELAASVLMRGVEGFGIKHHLRTDRLLTLSEDLPLVAVALDQPARIERVLDEVKALGFDGLVTVERARFIENGEAPEDDHPEAKLTLYPGRGHRANGRPAYEEAVQVLHDAGVAGATVLLGVDGTIAGIRRRARFFARNQDVPMMIISVGPLPQIADAIQRLGSLSEHVMTLERVRVLKRDGETLSGLGDPPSKDAAGLGRWVKLMLYSGEQNHFHGRPAHVAAIRSLREGGACGATALRGVWGYHGDHDPHGDTFWSLRRRVPTLTAVIDRSERAQEWLDTLDRVAADRGLITAEVVPAFQATAPQTVHGGLRLAELWRSRGVS